MNRLKRLLVFSLFLFSLNFTEFYIEPTYTYIKDINLPSPLKERIENCLKENDQSVHGMFSRKSLRPITIVMGKLDEEKLAESRMTPLSCNITINNTMNWNQANKLMLDTTILHELGHCFGFWLHDKEPSSIMYWLHNTNINQDSINKFLVRLDKRGHI